MWSHWKAPNKAPSSFTKHLLACMRGTCHAQRTNTLTLWNTTARGYLPVWDNFLHQIEPIASAIPYMAAAGNHERDWPGTGDLFGVEDSGGECGVPFERRMPMPYPSEGRGWGRAGCRWWAEG